jgi:hypothetical protein
VEDGRRVDGPRPAVVRAAIVVAAVLFGPSHLPALGQSVDLISELVADTVLLNAVVDVLFG